MTHQEILTKAIEKALSNGFDWPNRLSVFTRNVTPVRLAKMWTEGSTAYMSIIFNHDFAKALWGENKLPITHSHITLSIQPGYVDTTHSLHTGADIEMVKQHDYKCFSCGKVLGGNYWVNHEVCWTESEYNPGWRYHLQQMVIAEDPIAYLGANP